MATTDNAICVRSIDYSETSQVLVLLTRANGLVRLIAKGSKRAKSKSGGAVDFFAEGRCTFTGTHKQGLGTLMEFVETVTHTPLRDELAPVTFRAGDVGLALSGPDTGSSQFFVVLGPHPHLDGEYTRIG